MTMAVEQMGHDFLRIELRALGKLGQRLLVGERAALAAAEVIAGKEGTFGPGQGVEDGPHFPVGGDRRCGHGGMLGGRRGFSTVSRRDPV